MPRILDFNGHGVTRTATAAEAAGVETIVCMANRVTFVRNELVRFIDLLADRIPDV